MRNGNCGLARSKKTSHLAAPDAPLQPTQAPTILRVSRPTYVVVDMPADVGVYVRGMRERFSPLIAPLPVEITVVGSSGVGVVAVDTSLEDLFGAVDRIAKETAPIHIDFGAMATFPGSGFYFFPPLDPVPWRRLHRAFVASGLRFDSIPFPFTPHLTAIKLAVPEPPELAAAALSLAPPPACDAVSLSVYTLDEYDCSLLHRTDLTGTA